jgi:protease I
MDLHGKKIAILVDNNFEQAEFTGPLEGLKAAGAMVDVVSTHAGTVQGLQHLDKAGTFPVDITLDKVDVAGYDALVLPGGAVNADHLRVHDKAKQWVRNFLESGKTVAAICHAPWVVVSAGCAKGRHLTSYFTVQDDIRNAGGQWSDEAVVVDNNLITSRKPDDVPAFTQAIIKQVAAGPAPRAAM